MDSGGAAVFWIMLIVFGFLGSKKKGKEDSPKSFSNNNYELPVEYAYYIEPCQLCLERGDFNNCGWCTDYDSSAGNGKVKLPKGGWGYPYHYRAHSERKYYTVNDVHIPELDGRNVD